MLYKNDSVIDLALIAFILFTNGCSYITMNCACETFSLFKKSLKFKTFIVADILLMIAATIFMILFRKRTLLI